MLWTERINWSFGKIVSAELSGTWKVWTLLLCWTAKWFRLWKRLPVHLGVGVSLVGWCRHGRNPPSENGDLREEERRDLRPAELRPPRIPTPAYSLTGSPSGKGPSTVWTQKCCIWRKSWSLWNRNGKDCGQLGMGRRGALQVKDQKLSLR